MKKIIPPLLFLMSVIVMILLDRFMPIYTIFKYPVNMIGIVILLIGLAIGISVRKQFSQVDTEIHTFKQLCKLVTHGLFRYSRNPIYLGFVLCLTGIWILLGSVSPLFVVLAFMIITHYWYIIYEEGIMEKTFGEAYLQYKKSVRRWI